MKKLLLLMVMALGMLPLSAQRYLTEVFQNVDVTSDVLYGANITVITGAPALDSLYMDVYQPSGDTMTERPVVLVAHTGSFLPYPLNGQCTGEKSDYAVVELCNALARRGYVAVAFNYRLGWNPVGTQEERTGTLLNAAYRGIQDARTCVRYLRLTADVGGNVYGIDESKIVVGGIGTGGYISLGAGYLDSYDEINLAKFINPNTLGSYVDTSLSGDVEGKWTRPLNIGNHTSYSSAINMVFNMGGAIGDSTWLEAGEVPGVSFHCPNDPFAPYGFGAVIVPTTGDFVVNVSGSYDIQRRGNRLGVNASYLAGVYTDGYTAAANANNDGHEGLFPFVRPTPESGPWEYFDTTSCPNTQASLLTNPDMSMAKADAYIDSVANYLAPRMVCVLGLAGCTAANVAEELTEGAVVVYPNPAQNVLNVRSEIAGNSIKELTLIDLSGRTVRQLGSLKGMQASMNLQGISAGMYFLKVQTAGGMMTQKVMVD